MCVALILEVDIYKYAHFFIKMNCLHIFNNSIGYKLNSGSMRAAFFDIGKLGDYFAVFEFKCSIGFAGDVHVVGYG